MTKCSNCGAEIVNAKFCKTCGSSRSSSGASLDDKKARVLTREKTWIKPAAIIAAIVAIVAAGWMAKGFYLSKKMGDHPMFPPHRDASARLTSAMSVKAEGGAVHIPLATVEDGKAHFFAYAAGGKSITFFVMRAMDGSIRTALDACVACNHAKLGYRQEGNLVVCNNCGMSFKPTDIGIATGGCSPIPIEKSVDGQMIMVKASDLEAGAQYF